MAHSLTRTLSPTHPLALTFKPLLSIFLLSSFSFLLLFFFWLFDWHTNGEKWLAVLQNFSICHRD